MTQFFNNTIYCKTFNLKRSFVGLATISNNLRFSETSCCFVIFVNLIFFCQATRVHDGQPRRQRNH